MELRRGRFSIYCVKLKNEVGVSITPDFVTVTKTTKHPLFNRVVDVKICNQGSLQMRYKLTSLQK